MKDFKTWVSKFETKGSIQVPKHLFFQQKEEEKAKSPAVNQRHYMSKLKLQSHLESCPSPSHKRPVYEHESQTVIGIIII